MQINIKNLLYIPLILFFFPAFAVYAPFLNRGFYIFNIITLGFCLFFCIKNYKDVQKVLIKYYKKTPFKYYIWVLFAIIFNSIICSIYNFSLLINTILSILIYIIFTIVPMLIYFLYIIEKYLTWENFIKNFLILFWINLIAGFISWLGAFFDIEFINKIFDIFANIRLLYDANTSYDLGMDSSNYFAFGLPRMDNLFEEPSAYSRFLLCFLPMVYVIGSSKIKISKNKYLSWVIKKTLIPFTLLNIILTFSPIYLILSIFLTFLLYFKNLIKVIQNFYIPISIFIFLVTYCFFNIDLSETYLSRIINVLTKVKSFDDFILVEPSLACRVINYINSLYVFFEHPFGVGIGNLSILIKQQLLNSPLPLTLEIQNKLYVAIVTNSRMGYNKGFIYYFLAENGIIIFSLFVYFYYLLMKKLKFYLKKYIKNKDSFNYIIAKSLQGNGLSLMILFFYNILFQSNEFIMFIIMSIAYIYNQKSNQERTYKYE